MDYGRDDGILRSMADRETDKCYEDWKSDLHNHFKTIGKAQNEAIARGNRPETLRNKEHWGACCDRFISYAFQVI